VLRLRRTWGYAAFGAKSAASQILFYFYTNVDYPIVGYYFGDTAVGTYRLAYEIALEPVRVISAVVADVAFPTFARLRHDRPRLVAQLVSFTRLNLVTVMTYAAVTFVVADDTLAIAFHDYLAAGPAVRILCGVAVLRAVSYVVPPLLDGVGHPSRTLIYMTTAAVVLPTGFVLASVTLGDRLGWLAVAWAWAVGYPIAFAVLIALATTTIELPIRRFLGAVVGVPACALAGLAVGELVHALVASAPAPVRLVTSAAAVLAVTGLLLAYTQGLSVRSALRALRGDAGAG
jgi:O-antigen/teichoic acid export membrane protein